MTAAVRFVPFTEVDFQAWLVEAIPSFALTNVEDGRWTLAESIEKSKEAHAALLPQGLQTPGQFFVHLHDAGRRTSASACCGGPRPTRPAGARPTSTTSDRGARAPPRLRARGLRSSSNASRASAACSTLGLHVFGHNHGARRLYEALGFEPTSITLRKIL